MTSPPPRLEINVTFQAEQGEWRLNVTTRMISYYGDLIAEGRIGDVVVFSHAIPIRLSLPVSQEFVREQTRGVDFILPTSGTIDPYPYLSEQERVPSVETLVWRRP